MPRRPTSSVLVLVVSAVLSAPSAVSGEQARPTAARGARPAAAPATDIPAHPRDLVFPPLAFEPPEAAKFRRVLANGVPAYMVEDHELPLVTVTVVVRAGAYLEPRDKVGLAAAVASQMRNGGAGDYSADAFDEEVEFLAANLSVGLGGTSGSASANFLAKDTDRALDLFFAMLRAPAFQQDRLDLYKAQVLQSLERRNDSTAIIEAREFSRLMYGTDHFSTAQPTRASIEAITRDDLVAFHRQWFHPANFILAVSGDFEPDVMAAKLEQRMAGWASPPGFTVPPVPRPSHAPVPGIYLIHKPDVNQGRVSIGLPGIERGNPDEYALELMNDVLGGSGFTSRITNRVRSDEGLAYSAGSSLGVGVHYPGVFRAGFQSRSDAVARATHIVLEEMARIREERVSAEELETVKNAAIEEFPRRFASASAIASLFANDELTGRDPAYWRTYRDRIRAVTVDDVHRVARQYLHPDRVVILVVGNLDDILKGDPDRPQYSLETVLRGVPLTRIPLPDPVTLVYPPR